MAVKTNKKTISTTFYIASATICITMKPPKIKQQRGATNHLFN